MKKRILSCALALAVMSNLGPMMIPEAWADEIEIEEYSEGVAVEDAEPESSASEESNPASPQASAEEEVTAAVTVDIPEEETETTPAITGFVPLEKAQYIFEQKPSLDELTAMLPQTMWVYLDQAEEPQEIPVTWECQSDYTGTDEPNYVFAPVWDTQSYTMEQELSYVIPRIEISLNPAQEGSSFRILAEAAPVLTEISGTETKVTLKWNAVSNANKYHIYRKTNSTSWTKIGASESLTYTDETAQTKVSYSYAVRAIYIQNGTETRSERSVPYNRVGQPTLSSAKETSGGLQLSWSAVDSATGYAVYRRTSTKADWTLLEEVSKTSFTDDSAKLGTKYYYAVRAFCTNGSTKFYSAYSAAKSVKRTLAIPKVTSISGTKTKVTLKWKSVSGAKKYRIQRMESGGSWKTLGNTTKLTYQDKTAKASKTYRYRVCAVKTDSSGKTVYGMGQVPGLQRPGTTKMSSAASEANGIRVKWKAVSSVKKYRVYRRQKAGAKWKLIATVSDISYLDTKASAGTTYWYTVRAVGRNPTTFYGGFDTTGVKAKRTLTAPELTQISNAASGVKLEWNKANDVTGYRIYRKNAGASKWTTLKKSTTATSYTDKTASAGKKYTYSIRTINKEGTLSSYSGSRSITYLKRPTLKSASYTGTGIKVTWGTVTGASGYYVYRRANGSGDSWAQLAKVSGKSTVSYTDKTVANGSLYDYTVCAYYGTTKSAMNQTGVSEFYLKSVELLDLIQEESQTVLLSWETNDQADGYIVSYSTSESFGSDKTVQVTGTSTKISGLTQDEIYYFRVKAYKKIGSKQYETAWSESQVAAIET
ncbi:MAG: fibronectin type III domain-containing protein [Eubacteriales bacterium]|nr:fibronectin type III domain-containing protein [Eubacteriales bacterium]